MVQESAGNYFYGTGKRKTAIARVRLYSDDPGLVIVNGKPMEEYFNWSPWQKAISEPFSVTETKDKFRVVAKVTGGGVNAQAEAIRHVVARALLSSDSNLRPSIKKAGYLTRDSRAKERNKYGFVRARKRKQYTKR